MSSGAPAGLTAGQQAVSRAEAALAAAAARPLLDVHHRSTTEQREGFLERLYTDYAELNRQREEVGNRKRQMDFDMYESNQQDIHDVLFANVEAADGALGDWDTWERVEAVVRRYAYGRPCHNAAEKKEINAMQSRIDALTQAVQERSAALQSLTLNFDSVQQELAGVLKLLRLKDNEIHTLSNQSNTAMLQLRCVQRECTALRGLRSSEDSPAIKEDLRFLIEANKNLEEENRQLRRRLNAREGLNSTEAAVPALRGADELVSRSTAAMQETVVISPPPAAVQDGDLDRCLEDDAYRHRFLHQRIPLSGAVVDAKREAEAWKLRLEAEVRRTMELLDRDAIEMDELATMPMDRGGQMGFAQIENGVFTSYATYQNGSETRPWRDNVPVVSAPPLPAFLPVSTDAAHPQRPFALGASISASPPLFAAAAVVAQKAPAALQHVAAAPVETAKASTVEPPPTEDRKRRSTVNATQRKKSGTNTAAAAKKATATPAVATAASAATAAAPSTTATKPEPGNAGKPRRGAPTPSPAGPSGTGAASGGSTTAAGGAALPVAPRTPAAAATAPAPVKALRSAVLQCAELSRANALRRELLHVQWLRQQLLGERKRAATLAAVQAETAAQLAAATKMMAASATPAAESPVPSRRPRGEQRAAFADESTSAGAQLEEEEAAAEDGVVSGRAAASRRSQQWEVGAETGFEHYVPPTLTSHMGRSDSVAPLRASSSLISAPERLRHRVEGSRPSTLTPELAADGGEVESSPIGGEHAGPHPGTVLLGESAHESARTVHSPGFMTTPQRTSTTRHAPATVGGRLVSQQGAGFADQALRCPQASSSHANGDHGSVTTAFWSPSPSGSPVRAGHSHAHGAPPSPRAAHVGEDTAVNDDGTYVSWLRAHAAGLRKEVQRLRLASVAFGDEVQEALRLLSAVFDAQHAEARRVAEAQTVHTMHAAAQEAMEEATVARVTQLLEERFGAHLPDDFEVANDAPLPESATDEQWLSHELRLAAFAMVRETVQSHTALGGAAGDALSLLSPFAAAADPDGAAEHFFENDILTTEQTWIPGVFGTAKRWKGPGAQSDRAGAPTNIAGAQSDQGTAGGDSGSGGLQLRGKGVHGASPRLPALPPTPAQWYWHTRGPAAVPDMAPPRRGAPAGTGALPLSEVLRTAAFAGPVLAQLRRAPNEPVSLQPTVLRYKLGSPIRQEQHRVNAQVQSAAAFIYGPSFEGFVREYILPVVMRASQVGHGATMDPALRAAVRQLREKARQRNKQGVRLLFDRVANNIRTRRLLRRNVHQGGGFASYIGVMYDKWRGKLEQERRKMRAMQQNRHVALLALLNLATPAGRAGGAAQPPAVRRPAPQQSGVASPRNGLRVRLWRAQHSSYHFDDAHFDQK